MLKVTFKSSNQHELNQDSANNCAQEVISGPELFFQISEWPMESPQKLLDCWN